MSKQRKNLFIIILLSLTLFLSVIAFMPFTAKGENNEQTQTCFDNVVYRMIPGAQARKTDDGTSGLRFGSYLDSETYNSLEQSTEYDFSYGMLIAPVDYIEDNALTEENVFGENAIYCWVSEENSKKQIINLTSDTLVEIADNLLDGIDGVDVANNDYVGFKGIIYNIKEFNYTRKFVGVAYIKAQPLEGNPEYLFVTEDKQVQLNSARSIAEVAKVALQSGIEDTEGKILAKYSDSLTNKETLNDVLYGLNRAGEGDVIVPISVEGEDYTVVVSVDENVVDATFANGIVTIPESNFASTGIKNVDIQIKTNNFVEYKADLSVEVVDCAIGSQEELYDWFANGFKNKATTVVLTNDIILDGEYFDNQSVFSAYNADTESFKGTFDGRGHTIANFNAWYGFFGFTGSNSTFKNLALVNMTICGRDGYLGCKHSGTLENIYIQGQHVNASGSTAGMAAVAGFTRYMSSGKFTNVVMNVDRSGLTNAAKTYALFNSGITDNNSWNNVVKNVYIVVNNTNGNLIGTNGADKSWKMTDVYLYETLKEMQGVVSSVPSDFSTDMWIYDATYGLIMESAATFLGENIIVGLNQDSVSITVDDGDYTVKAYINDVEYTNTTLTVVEGKVELPVTSFSTIGNYKLKLQLIDAQTQTTVTYNFVAEVVDYAIGSQEELYDWFANGFKNKATTVVLTNDIILDGEYFDNQSVFSAYNADTESFKGTFDGRGYTIANFNAWYGFFGFTGSNSTFKNFALVNMTICGRDGYLGCKHSGTLENIYIQGQHVNASGSTAGMAAVAGFTRYTSSGKFTNVVMNVDRSGLTDDAKTYALFNSGIAENNSWNNVVKNVYIVANNTNGNLIGTNGADKSWKMTDVYLYETLEEMQGVVSSVPSDFSTDMWTYDATYGLIMESALNYSVNNVN